ncbi:MAG: metallophosphatase family protein [Thermoflexales bacterium]|nr:metallophosphatase family protein [Thermoflexales bacterium]
MEIGASPSTPIVLTGCQQVGVLSDTHVPHRLPRLPAQVFDALRGCDVILHAGDLESPEILAELGQLAPTYAVRGNLHWQFSTGAHDQDLPVSLFFLANGRHIWLTHGHLRFRYSILDKVYGLRARRIPEGINSLLIERLSRLRPPQVSIVIFGHSHKSCAVHRGGALFFNPGAVAAIAERHPKEPPRIGVLHFRNGGQVAHEWRPLT